MSFGRIQITDRIAVDPNLSTGSTHFGSTDASSMPIDFGDALTHSLYNDNAIPGGGLGPNGYMDVYVTGAFSITANRTVALTGTTGGIPTTVTTQSLGADTYAFEGRVVFQNVNSEALQRGVVTLVFGRDAAAPSGPYIIQLTETADTTQDWGFQVSILASGGVSAGNATVDLVRVLTQYIP